jgi:(E)-2-((N-methylformamido)methylene)succinate hydrolase
MRRSRRSSQLRGGIPPVTPMRRRRRRGGKALGVLGLAAAGVGVVLLARREGQRTAARAAADTPAATPPRDAPEVPGREIAGPAGTLFVRTAGESGPPLLLLHALGGNGAHWQPQLAALAGSARMAAPDLRGHGRSAAAADGPSIADYAADALAVADALGFARFAVAGHSMGALVAIEVAAAHPGRVLALALVDPGGDTSADPALEAAIAGVAEDARGELTFHYRDFLHGARPSTARRVLADLAATDERVLAASFAAAMRYPARQRLLAYRGPKLCLASPLNDTPQSLPRQVPELAVEWLAPASHWLALDRPEQTSYLLGQLLAAAAGDTPAGARA